MRAYIYMNLRSNCSVMVEYLGVAYTPTRIIIVHSTRAAFNHIYTQTHAAIISNRKINSPSYPVRESVKLQYASVCFANSRMSIIATFSLSWSLNLARAAAIAKINQKKTVKEKKSVTSRYNFSVLGILFISIQAKQHTRGARNKMRFV